LLKLQNFGGGINSTNPPLGTPLQLIIHGIPCYRSCFHNLISVFYDTSKKLKLILKNTITDKTLTYPSETSTLTKRHRKQLNIFERKVYRRILGPVYDNEKENWRILSNKEIYVIVKKHTITETIRLHSLHWFGHVLRIEEDTIPKRVLCMNLETTRPRGRPRNRWQDEVREDGRIVCGEE
jgi:hypothetical protein